MEYAHKVSNLEMGKYYLVAHATIKGEGREISVPVIPILHEDKEFSPAPKHYHVDFRFRFSKDAIGIWSDYAGIENHTNDYVSTYGSYILQDELVYKAKKCIGTDTGIVGPPVHNHWYPKFNEWKKRMEGKSCKGRKCPHHGATMMDHVEVWKCPMHGLIGNPKTELIENG